MCNRHIKRIRYGNKTPAYREQGLDQSLPADDFLFEVVFDYDEAHYEELPLDPSLSEAESDRK